jgi:hypothetical protein
MNSIGDLLGKRKIPTEGEKKAGGINSERAEMIDRLMSFMREDVTDGKRFKYWLGRTRKLGPAEIYRLMNQAKDGRNSQALFNYLLKNYGKK